MTSWPRRFAQLLAVFTALLGCNETPYVFPYPPSTVPPPAGSCEAERDPSPLPPAAPVAAEPPIAAVSPAAAVTPVAAVAPAVPVAPLPPAAPTPGSPSWTPTFHLGDGTRITYETDAAPPPLALAGGRWSFGPAGDVVVDGTGREAWFSGAAVEEITEHRTAHARITSEVPEGMRLLPIADLDDRGCMSYSIWALFDPRTRLVYTDFGDSTPAEPAPGAGAGAAEATVLLRFVRHSQRSGEPRVLFGPREAVEAAPDGGAPGGWVLHRNGARVSGHPLDAPQPSPVAPGLTYAMMREPVEDFDGGGTVRFWITIDGRRVEAFDAALESPEMGVGGAWRSGDRVVVWFWAGFWSQTYYAVVDARAFRRIGSPVVVSPAPDWELCTAAALHDNRVLAVLGDDDRLSFAFLAGHSEDEWDQRAIFYGPRAGTGRLVPAKLPNLEDPTRLPPVLHFIPCGQGQCLAQVPGDLVTGPVETEF